MRGVIVILCLLFVNAAFAADPECADYDSKCAAANAACGSSFDSAANKYTSTSCSKGQYCNATVSATGTTGNCINFLSTGADCSPVGSRCADGSTCYTTFNNGTISSICTAITTVGANAKCNAIAICQNNMYCNTTDFSNPNCAMAATGGQDCTTMPCIPGYFCNADTMKCTAGFTLAAGTKCTRTSECAVGLSCTSDRTCAAVAADSKKSCTGPTDITSCTAKDESCQFSSCNKDKMAQYTCQSNYFANTADEKKDYDNFASCKNSNLDNVCDSHATSTCSKCTKQACAEFTYPFKTCGNGVCSGDAATVAASVFMIALAILVAL